MPKPNDKADKFILNNLRFIKSELQKQILKFIYYITYPSQNQISLFLPLIYSFFAKALHNKFDVGIKF